MVASAVFSGVVWPHAGAVFAAVLIGLFAILTAWISLSFWVAAWGFAACWCAPKRGNDRRGARGSCHEGAGRTAIVMPIYNEDPARVFAGLRATWESLQRQAGRDDFDAFILSDSTNADLWAEEECRWVRLRAAVEGGSRIFYRRRYRNVGRKSGNIADFCQRWGRRYRYMVVLDADSVMSGETIGQLVDRMEADAGLGILQTAALPVNRVSLFARSQQFAADVYGRMMLAGHGLWSGCDGNYLGHNAIIRVAPFHEHCGLPLLRGRPPLGGEIFSHDFVEASLMRRAGWKVKIAADLGGSFEECPTNLVEYAKRDQRWCQGNMQHVRLILAYGFHPISRVHFSMGAMAYLSSPLWLLLIVLSALTVKFSPAGALHRLTGESVMMPASDSMAALVLFCFVMGLLLLPKCWGYLLLFRDRARLRAHGGAWRAGLSVLLEAVISVAIAPIMMMFHVAFVVMILLGRRVEWAARSREDLPMRWAEAVESHAVHTMAGLAGGWAMWVFSRGLFWWTVPVTGGLMASIPLSMLLSSVEVGRRLHGWGMLLIPEETYPSPVLSRLHELLREQVRLSGRVRKADPFVQLLADPVLNAIHLDVLAVCEDQRPIQAKLPRRIRRLCLQTPGALTVEEKLAVLGDPAACRELHRLIWARWPMKVLRSITAESVGASRWR